MKFIGFAATYSPETNEITNKHNYFMNGLMKDDVSESACLDVCEISKMRNLYAITDGSKSVGKGENAAYLCMDMMGDVFGSDFEAEQKNYFDSANDVVKGRSFQENGLEMSANIGVLYCCGNWARAYNVGDISIFHQRNETLTKISGEMPESVEVEEVLQEDGQLKIEKEFKKNVPHIGYLSDDFVVVPHISEKIKVSKSDIFVMATESVMSVVGEDNIRIVLSDKNIPNDEKASAIINLATEKNPDGNYTVEIIITKAPQRIKGVRVSLIALMVMIILGIAGVFAFPHIHSAGNSIVENFTGFMMRLMYGDIADNPGPITEPWMPMVDKDDEAEDERENKESEGENKVEEQPQPVQKPVTTPATSTKPATKPSASQNSGNGAETPKSPAEEETPVAPPPSLENNNVELPIDFD